MISGNTSKMFRIWWQREIGTKANLFCILIGCVPHTYILQRTKKINFLKKANLYIIEKCAFDYHVWKNNAKICGTRRQNFYACDEKFYCNVNARVFDLNEMSSSDSQA